MRQELQVQGVQAKLIQEKKFIQTMNTLTQHIRSNIGHQVNIFQCLNSDQQRKLFESIKQEKAQLRITAIVFILYLLHKNERVLTLIMKREGLQLRRGMNKYIIGGLQSRNLQKHQLIRIIDQIERIQYQDDMLCWSLNLETHKIRYLKFEKNKQERISNQSFYDKQVIDPKYNLIGISIKISDPLSQSMHSLKSNMSQSSLKSGYLQRYKISRR